MGRHDTVAVTAHAVRDVRVDRIGFVDELKKHFADDLRTALKLKLAEQEAGIAEGDFFEGKLVESSSRECTPASLLRLYEDKQISRTQLLDALTVNVSKLSEFLGKQQINALCSHRPGTPRLVVTRKQGAEITLVDAVRGISDALK